MAVWLELKNVKRSFGSIHALKSVNLTVEHGEVVGLVGENGAGKSTLMKIMSGFDPSFEGELLVDGEPIRLGTPAHARAHGIAIAQQELSLIHTLTIAENIFIGGDHGPTFASLEKLIRLAKPYLDEVGLDYVDPAMDVSRLSVGERHLVEVARLLAHKPQLLILDEPTAALGETDSQRILAMVRRLKEQGKSIVYVSHRMDEIFAITDRCSILRDGQSVDTVPTSNLNTEKLVSMMLGRKLSSMFPKKAKVRKKEKQKEFRIVSLWPDRLLAPVSFTVRRGEILGLAGQLGSGTGEILAGLAGAHPVRSGKLLDEHDQQNILPKSPKQAIAKRIAYCSPDRKFDGLFLGRPIRENLTAPNLRKSAPFMGLMVKSLERAVSIQLAKSFTIDASRLDQEAAVLSGGNQQKVALGKWLSIDPVLVLTDEPTRGVDVGARAEIYARLRSLADQGAAIIIASTDLLEISNLPDRVLTFYKGAMVDELIGGQVNSDRILHSITNPTSLQLEIGEVV